MVVFDNSNAATDSYLVFVDHYTNDYVIIFIAWIGFFYATLRVCVFYDTGIELK
ncbi:MAG: hypothetical protein ACI9QV_000358 [Methylophagaceae bacterium]|jgi:hypothetical protein